MKSRATALFMLSLTVQYLRYSYLLGWVADWGPRLRGFLKQCPFRIHVIRATTRACS